jgi:hypothetical protein
MSMSQSDTKKTLEVMLYFGVDNTKAVGLKKKLSEFAEEFKKLEKEAEQVKADLNALDGTAFKGGLEQELAKIEAQMQAVSNQAKQTSTELSKMDNAVSGKSAYNMRDIGEKMNQVGQAMTNAGMGITNTLMGSVNAYLAASGQYSAEAVKWNSAQKEMQDAYARIGAVAIDELTPYLETAADFMDKLATFIEDNPDVIKVLAGTGGILAVGGQIVSSAAQIAMIFGSLEGLLKLLPGGVSAAGEAGLGGKLLAGGKSVLGSAAFVPAAVGTVALATGASIGNNVANAAGWAAAKATGKEYDWQSFGDNLETAKMSITGSMGILAMAGEQMGVITKEQSVDIFQATKSLLGLGDSAKQIKEKIDPLTALASNNLDAFMDFEKQKAAAAAQYGDQVKKAEADAEARRLEIIENFTKQAAKAEADYSKERARAQRDFSISQARAESDHARQNVKAAADFARAEAQSEAEYYRSRQKSASDFGLEAARMEEDHQREMLRLQQGHARNVNKLIGDRDALGLMNEQQTYETSRAEAESNYNLEAARKNEDFARSMAEAEANFALSRAQRLADFQRTSAENEAQYAEQRAQRAADFATQQAERAQQHIEQMAQMQAQKDDELKLLDDNKKKQLAQLKATYDQQAQTMQTAFTDRLNAMTKSIMGDTAAYETYMTQKSAAFEAYLRSMGYAGGGSGGGNTSKNGGSGSGGGSGYRKAAGGYAPYGRYTLGDSPSGGPGIPEFVVDGPTTRTLEGALGSRLSQRSLAGMAAGAQGSSSTILNFYMPSGATLTESKYTRADKDFIMQTLAERL